MRPFPHSLPPALLRAGRWFAASRYAVPATVLLALVLRLAVIGLFPITPIHDSQWYLVRGREIASGMGFQESGHPTASWPVGYPALIGFAMFVFGPSLFGPILFNLIAQAATLALILWFARLLTRDETAARLVRAALCDLSRTHHLYRRHSSGDDLDRGDAAHPDRWLLLGVGAECDVLRVVDDQHDSPTSAADLAAALATITVRLAEDADAHRVPRGNRVRAGIHRG